MSTVGRSIVRTEKIEGAKRAQRAEDGGGGERKGEKRVRPKIGVEEVNACARSAGSFIETLGSPRSEAASLDSLQPPVAFVYLGNNLVFLPTNLRTFRRMDVCRLRDLYDRARFKCAR